MLYCWKCSDPNPDHYRFCGQCGAPAQRPAAAPDKVDSASAKESTFESARRVLEKKIADSIIEVETSTTESKGIRILRTGAGEKRRFVVIEGDGEPKEYATLEEIPEDLQKKIGPALAVADDKRWDSARFDVMESLIDRFRRPYPFDGFTPFSRKAPEWAVPPAMPIPAHPALAPSAEKKKSGIKWWFWPLAIYGLYKLLT